jgi:hypothetical protein
MDIRDEWRDHGLSVIRKDRAFNDFMSIWPWNRQPTFAIGESDITQGVEP